MQFKNNTYKAVLFDFDGVLANTMHDNFTAWHTALSTFGLNISKEDYFVLEGLKPKDVAAFFLKAHKLDSPENIEKAAKQKESEYLKIMNFSLYPDVERLLRKLISKKIKIAVVTGASKERFTTSVNQITHFNFIELFDEIITASDYREGKPAAEPYLAAVNKLAMQADDCLVIENAPMGITSAQQANIKTVALCTTLDQQYLSEANYILKDISSLYKEIFGVK